MSKPLSAIHHVADVSLVPGEDSSTGNVTGGRKLAPYVLAELSERWPSARRLLVPLLVCWLDYQNKEREASDS
jgi:hypothetical protein